ncbi:hypothetical protein BH20ACT12_BH20ACT12_00610 [soil metagenome]
MLVAEILVRRDEYLEASFLRCVEQVTILEFRPAEFVASGDFVFFQGISKRDGSALIEKDPHSGGDLSAPRRVFQHGADLIQ